MRFSRPMNRYLFASLVGLLLALPLSAQAQEKEEEYVLRTYEVGDLTMTIADHPYGEAASQPRRGFQGGGFAGGRGFGGGGFEGFRSGGMRQDGAGVSSNSMANLYDVIVSTAQPDSWTKGGGGIEKIRPFGTALVVWQTEPVHQKIEQLLTALRAGPGNRPTLKVDARWLLLNSDDLAQLTPAVDNGRVDRRVLAQFTRRSASIRGLTSCFSGQLVYVVSGTQRNIVSGYIPVVGSVENPLADEQFVAERSKSAFRFAADSKLSPFHESGVGYQPIVQTVNLGALLEIRPTLVPGNKTAVVDLTATITTVSGQQGNFERLAAPPAITGIAIEKQQLATTLRLPLAEPVIVGGLTYRPVPAPDLDGEQASGENPQLYLILQITK